MYSIGTKDFKKVGQKESESEFLDKQMVIILSISFQMVLNYRTPLKRYTKSINNFASAY